MRIGGEQDLGLIEFLYDENELNEKRHIVNGITVGIVTNIDDPEGLGRAKVKLIYRDNPDFETDFAPVVTTMMGDKWGTWFFPQVGDFVAVAFIEGEISKPVIIGSIWNKEKGMPPFEIKDGKNDLRGLKTRSSHQLIFDDTKDKEKIQMNTPKNLTLSLDDEKEVIVISDKEQKNLVKIDVKNKIIDVAADKKINLFSGNSKIEIDGESNKIVIESNNSIDIKANNISLNSKNNIEIKASSGINLSTQGQVNISGTVVNVK